MVFRPAVVLLGLVLACAPAASPSQPATPTARLGAVLVAHPAHKNVLLSGGRARSGVESDTWSWSGGRWRPVATPTAPPARSFAAAAVDGRSGDVILFGGDPSDPVGTHDDTWRWDGATWSPLHPKTVPDGGAFRTMGQGPDGAPVLVVFLAGGGVRTWTWDGDWRPAPAAAGAPLWRDDSALVPDRAGHRLLLVGGMSRQGLGSGDTWAWDGHAWTELRSQHRPGGGPASIADLAAGPLLYEQDGTWAWSGDDWTLVQPSGEPRWRPYTAMAAIPGGDQAVLLTGAVGDPGQTWRWTGRSWARD